MSRKGGSTVKSGCLNFLSEVLRFQGLSIGVKDCDGYVRGWGILCSQFVTSLTT